jgi:hypothetical protein
MLRTRSRPSGEIVVGNVVLALLVLVCLLLSLVFVWNWFSLRKTLRAAQAWPTAPGRILSSYVDDRVINGERLFEPTVSYVFEVDGREMSGERVNFSGRFFTDRTARAEVDRFPPGSAVTVHYDPADPAKACLELAKVTPKLLLWSALMVALALFFGLLMTVGD